MAIPEQFLDELTARTDIVDVVGQYVPLTRKGANYWGLCPFHHERTPSFSVSPDKQIFYCFGCHKGGGAIRFLMELEGLPFHEAVQKLAAQAGLEVPEERQGDGERRKRRARLLELNKQAARFYREALRTEAGAAAADYIRKRAISPKFSARFGLGAAGGGWDGLIRAMAPLGYDKRDLLDAGLAVAGKNGGIYDKFRDRLMLPVIDVKGDVIGFTSRVLSADASPKYLNTPETALFKKRSILYGLNYAKNTRRGNLILVEGNIDVITLHQAGFDNAVAAMGTSLTEEHIRILSKYTKELVLCYDNDTAGAEATQRALGLLRNSELEVKVLRLPNRLGPDGEALKQDADDYIKANGPEAFDALLNGSENSVEYRMGAVRARFDLSSDESRAGYLQAAAELLASLSSPVEREIYAGRAAEAAKVSREAVLQEVERLRRQRAWKAKKQQERRDLSPVAQLQPGDRELRYKNVRSARAEEGILRIVLLDGEFFRQLDALRGEDFTSPLLGRVFELLRSRWQDGKSVALAALDGALTPAETDHIVTITQQPQPRNTAQAALEDYISIIRQEAGDRGAEPEDLLSIREKLKEKKSYGGA